MKPFKKLTALTLAISMAVLPGTEIMASAITGQTSVEEAEVQVLTSENMLSEDEIKEMEEHYAFIQKMKEEYENNPEGRLSRTLQEEVLNAEEIASYNSAKPYTEQLREEIEKEVEKRSATKKEKKAKKVKKGKTEKKHSYKEVLKPSKKSLSKAEKKKVKKVKNTSKNNPKEAAENINQLEGDTFYAAVKDVLDGYYADAENVEEEKVTEFVVAIDDNADEIIEGYEEALKERQNAENLNYETEHVIVTFDKGTAYTQMQEIADCFGGEMDILDGTNKDLADYMVEGTASDKKVITKIGIGVSQTVEMAQGVLNSIDCVVGAEPNAYMEAASVSTESTNDRFYADGEVRKGDQDYLEQINVKEAWNVIAGSLGYCNYEKNKSTIAIIDTGFDVNHYELKNVLSKRSVTIDEKDADGRFMSIFECKNPYYENAKDAFHGSHVAGIIAAQTNNEFGIVGITNIYDVMNDKYINTCEIIGIAATKGDTWSKTGNLAMDYVVEGIYYAMECDVDVINMSLGHKSKQIVDSTALETSISEAYNKDIVLVAAAGNDGSTELHYPAAYKNVISVAMLNEDGNARAEFSNYGPELDIAAPGMDIYSCGEGNSLVKMTGTSMATPMVAAAVGMMRAVNKELSVNEIMQILYATATDLYTSGRDDYTGYGRLNLGKAVQQARLLKFADTYTQMAFSGKCYRTQIGNNVYASFDLNPVVDEYTVYRATNPNELGVQIAVLNRSHIDKNSNTIQFADWNLPQGTYYYNIIGKIFDDNNVVEQRIVIGEYVNKPFEVVCDIPDITLQKYNGIKNSLLINYKGSYDRFVVSRAKNSAMSQELNYFNSLSIYLTDAYGVVGTQYYYKVQAIKKTEHMTYYSNTSNVVSMIFE